MGYLVRCALRNLAAQAAQDAVTPAAGPHEPLQGPC